TLTATDPEAPPQTLTYSIVSGAQAGMSLNAGTGAFSWTPSEAQDGTYTVTFQVADSAGATNTKTVTITANEVNTPPTLTDPGPKTVQEANAQGQTPTTPSFNLSATAPDLVLAPPNTLTYSIASGAQAGMSLTSAGAFSWAPTEAQDGTYNV